MPVDYSGTIVLEHPTGTPKALIELSYAPSFAAVQQFAGVLHTLSTASIIKCTFTESVNPELPGSGSDYDDLSLAAMFSLRRTDPEADVRFRKFRLPAPNMDMFEHIPDRGYRIKQSYGETLAAAFSTLAGEEFLFDSGWLVS